MGILGAYTSGNETRTVAHEDELSDTDALEGTSGPGAAVTVGAGDGELSDGDDGAVSYSSALRAIFPGH